jgi:dynein light chain 1
MDNLSILSLGKNLIKKIENLDGIADTLEELWISYNQVVGPPCPLTPPDP